MYADGFAADAARAPVVDLILPQKNSARSLNDGFVRPESERRGCPNLNPWRPAIFDARRNKPRADRERVI
jgi:hypothetical protein